MQRKVKNLGEGKEELLQDSNLQEVTKAVSPSVGTASASQTDGSIEVGTVVEAKDDVLGESDISKPKIEKVVRDDQGQIEEVVIKKGVIFQKEIIVPANRLQAVEEEEAAASDPDHNKQAQAQGDEKAVVGKVGIEVEAAEIEQLKSGGKEEQLPATDLISRTGQALPTESGLRELEEQKHPLSSPVCSRY